MTWTCLICGSVHPIDHEGMFAGSWMICCSCELVARERMLGAPLPQTERHQAVVVAIVECAQEEHEGAPGEQPRRTVPREGAGMSDEEPPNWRRRALEAESRLSDVEGLLREARLTLSCYEAWPVDEARSERDRICAAVDAALATAKEQG
jgi:hypothetical protein